MIQLFDWASALRVKCPYMATAYRSRTLSMFRSSSTAKNSSMTAVESISISRWSQRSLVRLGQRCHVPELDGAVGACRGEPLSIARERHRAHLEPMALQNRQLPAAAD